MPYRNLSYLARWQRQLQKTVPIHDFMLTARKMLAFLTVEWDKQQLPGLLSIIMENTDQREKESMSRMKNTFCMTGLDKMFTSIA